MNVTVAQFRPAFVGIDDGQCAVKLVTEDGRMLVIPSRAAGTPARGVCYTTDDGVMVGVDEHVGPDDAAPVADFALSPHSRALVHHALRQAGFGGRRVRIATGLPVAGFYHGGERNTELIGAKLDHLRRPVRSDAGACADIVGNVVASGAVAAYFDQLIDMDGGATAARDEVRHARVAVIDVGGDATHCAVLQPGGTEIDTDRSGAAGMGARGLQARVDLALRQRFGFDEVPPALVDDALCSGIFQVHGQGVAVQDLVLAEKEALAEDIMRAVRERIGTGRDLAWLLFAGGGAVLMRDQLARRYPHCRFPDHPQFANARGMLKIAKYVFGAKD